MPCLLRDIVIALLCSVGKIKAFSATVAGVERRPALLEDGKRLENCVCLVTGASRGIGKGIALELGHQGATVYVTGTTTTGQSTNNTPGTIEETADLIDDAGGKGIAIKCNHAVDSEVQDLMNRIEKEHGRLDILVNNVFRLPEGNIELLNKKFWEAGPAAWDSIHQVGLRSHYVATAYATPLLFKARDSTSLPRPLVVMISSFGGLCYTFNVAYGVGKAGVDRLAKDMAVELTDEDICVVSLYPGVVDTERNRRTIESGEWEEVVGLPLDIIESTRLTGRAVVSVAIDPDNMKKTGQSLVVAELADEYGFTDLDGQVPPSIRSLRFLLPQYGFDEALRKRIPTSWIPDWKLPFWVMAQGRPPERS